MKRNSFLLFSTFLTLGMDFPLRYNCFLYFNFASPFSPNYNLSFDIKLYYY